MGFYRRLLPVKKRWLYLAAGLMWSIVGIVLSSHAYRWLKSLPRQTILQFFLPGFLLASLIYTFGFSHLAKENIQRIHRLPGKRQSLFRFQRWTSYPVVVIMVSLGIYLRKYSPLPKPILGSMYIGIGGGLFSSSIHYYAHLWNKYMPNNSNEPGGD